MYKTAAIIALCVLASACGAPRPQKPRPAAAPPVSTVAAGKYRIDPARSELRLLVYRAGVAAALGHNHVIVNRSSVAGWVSFAGDPLTASFALSVPVGDFVVDDPAARREEGADFAEETPEEARSGTLHNMLGPQVLDAAEHPAIEIKSLSIHPAGGGSGLAATVAVSVAGHDSTLDVPFALELSGGELSASGTMRVKQSTLGLTPFSVLLGALKVQDELTLKFRFVAAAG